MAFAAREQTTGWYTATIKDEKGVALVGADSALVTLKLSLFDEATGQIINSRSNQNVLNANGVTVWADGSLSWRLDPADNAIVNPAKRTERHIAEFSWTWGTPTKTGRHKVVIDVENFSGAS